MKNLAISLLASWGSSIRTFVDGDIFRESNIDLMEGDIADRLGYLKAQFALTPTLAGSNALTGLWTWAAGVAPGIVVLGDAGVTTTDLDVKGFGTFENQVTFTAASVLEIEGTHQTDTTATMLEQTATLADANITVPSTGNRFRAPIMATADRVYTLPTPIAAGRTLRIEKMHNDSHKLTVKNASAGTMCDINVTAAGVGWVEVRDSSTGWVVSAFGGDVTSILALV